MKTIETNVFSSSRKGHVNIVRLLIGHGADVTAIDRSFKTARQLAVKSGHSNVMELIDANLVTPIAAFEGQNNCFPLHKAVKEGSV